MTDHPPAPAIAAAIASADQCLYDLAFAGTVAGGGFGELRPAQTPPRWMVALVDRMNDLFRAGLGQACEHVEGAGVYHVAAWRPGLVVCADCLPATTPTLVEEWTCDACGHHFPGKITGCVTQGTLSALGGILLSYGLCPDCRNA